MVCVMMTDEDTSIWACLSVIVMSSIIHIKCQVVDAILFTKVNHIFTLSVISVKYYLLQNTRYCLLVVNNLCSFEYIFIVFYQFLTDLCCILLYCPLFSVILSIY